MTTLLSVNLLCLVGSVLWVAFDPGFEPVLTTLGFVGGLVALHIKKERSSVTVAPQLGVQRATDVRPRVESEVKRISERFGKVLHLMNTGRSHDPFTVAKLAQLMKLERVSLLENVFSGSQEPSFKFIEDFSKEFGVNAEWLTEGKGAAYWNAAPRHFDPLEYFEDISAENPKRIFFVLSKSPVGEALIAIQYTDWRFHVFPQVWHISEHVGGGGRSQIFGMYRLIMKLREAGLQGRCAGRIIDAGTFTKLSTGEVFPGTVLDTFAGEDPWWDDFTDVWGNYRPEEYENWYGKGFVFAQSVVRAELEYRGVPRCAAQDSKSCRT